MKHRIVCDNKVCHVDSDAVADPEGGRPGGRPPY